jgi:hypothetical protein
MFINYTHFSGAKNMPRSLTLGPSACSDEGTRLMEYFSYFEGTWQVTDLNGDGKGSMTIRRGEGGTSHVLEYGLGEERKTELWGYDPTSKNWTAIGFAQNGERYSQEMTKLSKHETPKAGDRWSDKHEGVLPSGEKTSSRLDFFIESEDSYTVKVTNIRVGESKQEDVATRMTRQRKRRRRMTKP